MKKSASFMAALAVAATPVSVQSPAHAAEVCGAGTATQVATSGHVIGTDGDDVIIVSGTVSSVATGAGNDSVCVSDTSGVVAVSTGRGADFVQTSVPLSLRAGRGADQLTFGYGSAVEGPQSDLDLGRGHDLAVITGTERVRANLRVGLMSVDGAVHALTGVEDLSAYARRIFMRGSGSANNFLANGCRVDLFGEAGDDTLIATGGNDAGPSSCPRRRAHIFGGDGDDILRGYLGNDSLAGGPGTDAALGGRGVDRCESERRRNCEKSLLHSPTRGDPRD